MRLSVTIAGNRYELEINQRKERWEYRIDGQTVDINVAHVGEDTLSILRRGKSYTVRKGVNGTIRVEENDYEVTLTDPRSWRSRHQAAGGSSGPQKLTSTMPGKVVRVLSSPGTHIEAGQGVVVIEAMKMQNEVRSPRTGRVISIAVREGQAVNTGELVAIVE